MRRKGLKGIALFMMILLLALTQMPVKMARAEEVFVKTKENTGLGTGTISNPTPREDNAERHGWGLMYITEIPGRGWEFPACEVSYPDPGYSNALVI